MQVDRSEAKARRSSRSRNCARASLLIAAALGLGTAGALVPSSAASAAMAHKVKVKMVTTAKYGKILETGGDRALYYYTKNKPGKWACKGSCLTFWPPLVLPKGQKEPVAGTGVTHLGTVKGPSGVQVTWKGMPLYEFKGDKVGTVKGQGAQPGWFVAEAKAKGGMTTPTTKPMTTTTAPSSGTTTATTSGGGSSWG